MDAFVLIINTTRVTFMRRNIGCRLKHVQLPLVGIAIFQTNLTDTTASPVTTYVVASTPEVLSMLMRDANNRKKSNSRSSPSGEITVLDPASYTVPASPLNTFTVDFALSSSTCSTTHLQKKNMTTTNALENNNKLPLTQKSSNVLASNMSMFKSPQSNHHHFTKVNYSAIYSHMVYYTLTHTHVTF